jgi:general secretion pathway protein B
MSFILDALRKSEIERQRQNGPSVAEFPLAREDRRLPLALLAIGFLLAVNLAVVLFFLLREAPEPAAQAAPAIAQPTPPAAAPASATPDAGSDLQAQLGPTAAPEEEPPAVYYELPATLPPDAPDPTLLPDPPGAGPSVTYSDPPAEAAAPIAAAGDLPQLTVDLHVFTDDPGKRAVFINGRRYTQGAKIAEGPVIEEITRDGAVLSWRGRRFLLPRL